MLLVSPVFASTEFGATFASTVSIVMTTSTVTVAPTDTVPGPTMTVTTTPAPTTITRTQTMTSIRTSTHTTTVAVTSISTDTSVVGAFQFGGSAISVLDAVLAAIVIIVVGALSFFLGFRSGRAKIGGT
jgi:hypothetical protein